MTNPAHSRRSPQTRAVASAALADFWAAALEYEVEDLTALIEQLLAADHIAAEAIVEHLTCSDLQADKE